MFSSYCVVSFVFIRGRRSRSVKDEKWIQMTANTLFSGYLLSTNVSSLCPQPAGSSFPRPLIQSRNSQVPCSWSRSLIFFKKASSLGNRGARKYLLIGLYMASTPLFSSPYNQSISKPCWIHIPNIPRITSSSLYSNNPVANYYQFLPGLFVINCHWIPASALASLHL